MTIAPPPPGGGGGGGGFLCFLPHLCTHSCISSDLYTKTKPVQYASNSMAYLPI